MEKGRRGHIHTLLIFPLGLKEQEFVAGPDEWRPLCVALCLLVLTIKIAQSFFFFFSFFFNLWAFVNSTLAHQLGKKKLQGDYVLKQYVTLMGKTTTKKNSFSW